MTKKTVPARFRILSALSFVPIAAALINLVTTEFSVANLSAEDLFKWSFVPGFIVLIFNQNTVISLVGKD